MKRLFFISVGITIFLIFCLDPSMAGWQYDSIIDGNIAGTDSTSEDDSLLISGNWGPGGVSRIRVVVITRDIATDDVYPKFAFVQYIDGYEHCLDLAANGSSNTDSIEVGAGDRFISCKLGMHAGLLGGQDEIVVGDSIMFKWSENDCSAGTYYVEIWREEIWAE